jgi:anti-anti-sigma factor
VAGSGTGDVGGARSKWHVVTIDGEIDMSSAPQLRARLLDAITAGHHAVILDLSAVTFMDSSGFAVVISAYKRLTDANGILRIAGAGTTVRSALRISGLDRIINAYPDIETAQAAVDVSSTR